MKLVTTATPIEVNLAPILLSGPISESFALASQYGFDGIEVHLRDPHDVEWEEMVELSRRYSLPVTTLGTGMAAGMDGLTFTDPEAGVRIRTVERVKEHIRLAARLGSAVTIGVLNGRLGSNLEQAAQGREHHLACLKECCHAAADAGVSLLLEPIAQLGFANLKYLADTYHMNIEEVNIAASMHRAGSVLGYIHLVDSNRCGPGQGHLPFGEVLNALIDVGYDGYLSLECLPKPDAESAIKNSLSYIKELLAGVARKRHL
jgi:sugar phosphate isomerase/epimerase